MKTSHWFLPASLLPPALTALLALAAVSPVAAETRVNPLDGGSVFVDLEGCSVVFNRRGDVVASGQSCSRGDLRRARDAYDSYRGSGPGESSGNSRGVTLYRDADYRGTSETFDRDIPDLRRTRIGNDELSSMRIPRGCRVTVYEDVDYRGRSEDLFGDVPEMSRTRIGNDQASSLRVSCGFRTVTLYRDADYRGTSEDFDRDVPDMRRTRIGNDELSSMRIPRGCRVTVFEDADYRGRAENFDNDVPRMSRTRIGNDRASSLRVSCR